MSAGDTYTYPSDIAEAEMQTLWMLNSRHRYVTYVAELNGTAAGTAYLKPNQIGLGDHIANAGWIIAAQASGQGIGRTFAVHVIEEAKRLGFTGMQFNAVVSTNTRAIALWESMGFEIVGTVPGAFRYATEGPTGMHIMYRSL